MSFNWRESHHLYWGAALVAVAGWAALATHHWPWRLIYVALVLLGLWVAGDDIYQHIRQASDPTYESSLHRWFYRQKFAEWPIVKKLNVWADAFFKWVGGLFA